MLARVQGDYRKANSLGNEHLALRQGDAAKAELLYAQSLKLFHQQGAASMASRPAWALLEQRQQNDGTRESSKLFGATVALMEAIGSGMDLRGDDLDVYHQGVKLHAPKLGSPAFEEAWDEGRAFSLEQAIAYALDVPGKDRP